MNSLAVREQLGDRDAMKEDQAHMRLLIVSPFYAPVALYGGIARATQDLAGAVAELGVRVHVLTTTANGRADTSESSTPRNGLTVEYFPRLARSGNTFFSLSLFRRCLAECRRHDAVLSVGAWNFPSFVASRAARRFGIPNFVALHGVLMPVPLSHHRTRKRLMLRTLERSRLSRADRVVCNSELERGEYLRLGLIDNVSVVPNIVDLRGIVPHREAFRQRHGLSSNFVILFAGRLLPIKGLELTVHAFRKLAPNRPEARLVIVGPSEGSYGERLKQLVAQVVLPDRVVFLGRLAGDAYWDALAGADLFILNSHSENFGLTAAEALGLGVPVVLSDRVGIAETVERHQAGLVTKLDIDSIAGAIDSLAGQREQLGDMGRRGMRLVREQFTPSAVGRLFTRLVEESVAKRNAHN